MNVAVLFILGVVRAQLYQLPLVDQCAVALTSFKFVGKINIFSQYFVVVFFCVHICDLLYKLMEVWDLTS